MDNGEGIGNKIKKATKVVLRGVRRFGLVLLVPIIIVVVLLASFTYFITIDDGTYKEDDWSSTPYANSQYVKSADISEDGKITTTLTAQEIWDEMEKNGGRANLYLDTPSELKKLMNAEMITQFVDTRANPDEDIDWEKINKVLNEKEYEELSDTEKEEYDEAQKEVQGIIKLKRADKDGNIKTLTYMDPDEFQYYIELYNITGSESAKEEVLSHFTLNYDDSDDGASLVTILGNGEFTTYDELGSDTTKLKQIARLCFQEQGSAEGAAAEASLMANLYELVGNKKYSSLYDYVRNSGWFAKAAYHMDNGTGDTQPGVLDAVSNVLVHGRRTLPKYVNEHDCTDDIDSCTNNGNSIDKKNPSKYKQHVTKIKNKYGSNYTYFCHPTSTSDPFGYTSVKNRKKYGDAYYKFEDGNYDDWELINGEDGGTKTSNTNSSTDDSSTASTDTTESTDSTSAESTSEDSSSITSLDGFIFIGDSYTEGIEATNELTGVSFYAKTGKAPQYWLNHFSTLPDNSDEVKGVSVLLGVNDPDQIKKMKDLIDKLVTKYDGKPIYIQKVFPVTSKYSGSGGSTELNSKIKKYNNAIKAYCETKDNVNFIDTTLTYVDNNGNAREDKYRDDGLHLKNYSQLVENIKAKIISGGSSSESSSSSNGSIGGTTVTSKYYAQVATWEEITYKKDSDDPDVASIPEETTYSMTTTNINYQAVTNQFTMPFDYLWALLVITEDKDFVMELAELVYNSEIEITVHDNLTEVTTITTESYTKKENYTTDGSASVYKNGSSLGTESGHWFDPDSNTYTVTETEIVKTNTLDIALTKANVWIVDYKKEYQYKKPVTDSSNETITLEDIVEPDETSTDDIKGHTSDLESQAARDYPDYTSLRNQNFSVLIQKSTVDRSQTIDTTTITTEYEESPATMDEKTEIGENDVNFVTTLLKHRRAMSVIGEIPSWLFEILETNDSTANMLDLTKYLLYKTTGSDYGITEFDFAVFEPSNFTDVSGIGIYGGTIQEKVWFALKSAGVSDVAAAGAMGNIHYESGSMDPTAVEGGYNENNGGIGICQWTNNNRGSTGRNTNLKKYADSKGVSWKDEDTQVEFLITELMGEGPAKGFATYEFMSMTYSGVRYDKTSWEKVGEDETKIEYATKAFAATFERPGAKYFEESMPTRVQWAKEYYKQFKGQTAPSGGGTSSNAFVNEALKYVGNRYVYGGSSLTNGCDCSHFVWLVAKKCGAIPSNAAYHNTSDMYNGKLKDWGCSYIGTDASKAQEGDIIVYRPGHIHHTAIYIGNGNIVEAQCTRAGITKNRTLTHESIAGIYRLP